MEMKLISDLFALIAACNRVNANVIVFYYDWQVLQQ